MTLIVSPSHWSVPLQDVSQDLLHLIILETEDEGVQEGYDYSAQDWGTFVEQHGLSLWYKDIEKNGASIVDDHHCKVWGTSGECFLVLGSCGGPGNSGKNASIGNWGQRQWHWCGEHKSHQLQQAMSLQESLSKGQLWQKKWSIPLGSQKG